MAKFVAVTACPTGIAHTFMAQEALLQAGKKLGHDVRVETQGALGAEDTLSEAEIREADAVIIAADKQVDLDRFAGKRLLQTSVSAAIKEPEKLLEDALAAPAFQPASQGALDEIQAAKQARNQGTPAVYRHLMNGVSHMLPLVIAGGIFIALSTAIDLNDQSSLAQAFDNIGGGSAFKLFVPILAAFIAQSIADRAAFAAGLVGGWIGTQGTMYHAGPNASAGYLGGIIAGFVAGYVTLALKRWIRVPRSLEGIKTVLILPVLSVGIVGLLMIYVLGHPVAALMSALSTGLMHIGASASLGLGALLGLMMAFDMGGPFNKVAYFFAVGLLATKTPEAEMIMAAVMGAGMVPPLAMAISAFLAPRKYSLEERDAAKAAVILGACFITEGAIPFATRDPLRVIPSIMVGSAVTGALCMLFHVTNPAPHGGIFVFPLIGHWYLFIVAILVGAAVGAAMVTLLKRDAVGQAA
ncbi:PTS fructose transporter subunit IIC [Alicyclobacillus vulcanalis]|uniref:PTS system D-fructose-specific IIB component (F1P-forming), Frc family /PTS system D-fructose-specific IIC component (F1P-forming), Frc family n=1 Tax=Alicyclobacillus vulcanalis TaxID=252246 RepID=A0A1N7M2U8_9BACL|nr:fructose-specific PTS transporter subunit EIIC [Alicyclobacillus vulcanalis]SIS80408.1 PTS system D-fructose-specific IIB component (F1P-forming), Frc family /PTS system D-fructose-specific IIC component (F1P-forming), Frc family [Alicyclobacillus vulcanalis]